MILVRIPHLVFSLAFALGLSFSSAFADEPTERPISSAICGDGLRSMSELAAIEAFRTELATTSAQREAKAYATKAVADALTESFADTGIDDDARRIAQDAKILIDNPIFDDALARAFFVSGIKKNETIREFQANLKLASEAHQLEFADMVVKQYADLLDQAFVHADEDHFERIGKRWNIGIEQTYEILTRWGASLLNEHAAIRLGVLAWAKAIDSESVVREIRAIKKIPKKMRITDAEEVLLTRIRQPHYDRDLAANVGPISDRQFEWRLRLWNFLGSGQYVLNSIRYPKESVFAIAFSVAPVTIIHAVSHDWNLTNTIATIIGGVATCPPLIAQMTKRAAIKNHEAIFLDVLTVKQLSELRRWIAKHPKRAKEVGFGGLEKPIDTRITALRELRYDLNALTPNLPH